MNQKNRYIRWQQIRIDQMGKVINLIMGLSTFNLGFLLNFISNHESPFACWQKWLFGISLFIVLLSIIFGVAVSLNRLYDFRWTAKKVGIKERVIVDSQDSNYYGEKASKLGKCTWKLLWLQLGAFLFGLILSVLAIVFS